MSAIGLLPDLGLGLHTDRPNRDSLVYDVCEPVRPRLESWLIRWVLGEPLQRRDFFETETGHVRLTSSFAAKLSETAPTWGKLVAPWAEYVARTLWASASPSKCVRRFPTLLTQRHRRQAKGQAASPSVRTPRPEKVCHGCGAVLSNSCIRPASSTTQYQMWRCLPDPILSSVCLPRSISALLRQQAAQSYRDLGSLDVQKLQDTAILKHLGVPDLSHREL